MAQVALVNSAKTWTLKNTHTAETDLIVEEILDENAADTYTDDSEDDLDDWRSAEMDQDEELQTLMEFMFGSESDQEDDTLGNTWYISVYTTNGFHRYNNYLVVNKAVM